MSVYPSYLLVSSTRYRLLDPEPATSPLYRIIWDDELEEYNYKSRTAASDWTGLKSTPAVYRYYPVMVEGAGDYRVDISAWKDFFTQLNNDVDGKKFNWWTTPITAQFNNTGWAKFAYIGTSGNILSGQRVGDWFEFETLRPDELSHAQGMTHDTHPEFIHRFGIVGYKADHTTSHVTITPQGEVFYPLITKEGIAYIPFRYVVKV